MSRFDFMASLALAVLICLGATVASAQKPAVERFTVSDGLPSPRIFGMAQDPSGRLWVATREGVSVYDGTSFRNFSADEGLTSHLRTVSVDPAGKVWAASWAGANLFYLENDTWHLVPGPTDAQQLVVSAFEMVGDGASPRAVVGTVKRGLSLWTEEGWTKLGSEEGLPSNAIRCLAPYAGGLAVGTQAGLCLWQESGVDCRIRDQDPRLAQEVMGLSSSVDGQGRERLWLLGTDWLGRYAGGELTLVAEGFELDFLHPALAGGVAEDPAGGLYFGTSTSGFFLDPEGGRVELMGQDQGLASEAMMSLMTDREANVWVGGLRGLSRVYGRRFESYDRGNGLLENEVTAIAQALDGTLILGHNTGLTLLRDGESKTLSFELDSPALQQRIVDIVVDGEGVIWAAAQRVGLLRITTRPSWEALLTGETVLSVEVDSRGDLVVGTARGLWRRQGGGFQQVEVEIETREESFRWLHSADDGRLFAGGWDGLRWLDGGRWQKASGASTSTSNILTVFVDSSTGVWVGTPAGLHQLRDGELVEARLGDTSIERPVYLIFRDPQGRIWFGTDDGVVFWDGERARRLSVTDGLAGRETNRGAGLVDQLGRVWIGTDQGMSMFRDIYDFDVDSAPQVELESIELADGFRSPETALELDHREKNLTFHFRAVKLSGAADLIYRYRLDGFEDQWVGPSSVSNMRARYTNLSAGTYRFRVMARSSGGHWSPEAVSAPIVITPPFWRRAWFYVLMLGSVGLLVVGFVKLRTRAILARSLELEALTEKLKAHIEEREFLISELESKNEELERFTYTVSHDLKSPLVTIIGFLGLLEQDFGRGDDESVRSDIARISVAAETMGHLLEDLLELSRVGRVVHRSEAFPLSDLVREVVGLLEKPIVDLGVTVDIQPDLPMVFADRLRFLEVFQNLIENAVKFTGGQPDPKIEIGVRHEEQAPVVYVRDNGIGIEPEYHEKIFGLFNRLDQTVEGTGVGLALVRRIIEVHGGRIWVESPGSGAGTAFCFTVPLPPADESLAVS